METGLILKIAGIGILVASATQILSRAGREDQAMMVSVAGIIMVLLIVLEQIGSLFDSIRKLFGI